MHLVTLRWILWLKKDESRYCWKQEVRKHIEEILRGVGEATLVNALVDKGLVVRIWSRLQSCNNVSKRTIIQIQSVL